MRITHVAPITLASTWQLELDPSDQAVAGRIWEKPFADAMQLRGTTSLVGKGTPLNIPINLDRPAMRSLQQRFRYVGPAQSEMFSGL